MNTRARHPSPSPHSRPTIIAAVLLAGAAAAACSGGSAGNAQADSPRPPVVAPPPIAAPVVSAPDPIVAATAMPSAKPVAAPAPEPPPPSPCPDGMVLIKGGTFKMASHRGAEETAADVCVDRTEVTAKAYLACMADGGCTKAHLNACDGATVDLKSKENHPIVCVDFVQASAYCAHKKMRLLSDIEWEWAARGRDENRPYPWGAEDPGDQVCWSGTGTRAGTCEVGSHDAGKSRDGLQDLTGNVLEWTTSPYDKQLKQRSARGGSWKDGVRSMIKPTRPGFRDSDYRCGFLGIRCAVEPTGPLNEVSDNTPSEKR